MSSTRHQSGTDGCLPGQRDLGLAPAREPEAAESPRQRPREILQALDDVLQSYRFRYSNEAQLHQAIQCALTDGGFDVVHERILDEDSRADFWLDGIVIEVKVAGSYADALHQIHRYARKPDVTGVLLATTKRWVLSHDDRAFEIAGKPVIVCRLERKLF